jgi:hypothetical protein
VPIWILLQGLTGSRGTVVSSVVSATVAICRSFLATVSAAAHHLAATVKGTGGATSLLVNSFLFSVADRIGNIQTLEIVLGIEAHVVDRVTHTF